MAFDLNLRLADDVDITADATGGWVKLHDVPSSSFTPRADTMFIADWEAQPNLVAFYAWIRGATLAGGATRVDLVLDIEEADDTSATNVRPVCRFRMGSGTVVADPSGYAYTKSATTTEDSQWAAVGEVGKGYARYRADITITGGGTATIVDLTIYAQGLPDATLLTRPAAAN